MMRYSALPHQYGAEVQVRDDKAFRRDYGEQYGDSAESLVIVSPSRSTLTAWAKSCLRLGPYKDTHPCGGWSPFRSAEVRVRRMSEEDGEATTQFFKLGDHNAWDFTSRTAPQHYPLHSWLQTLDSFVRAALQEYVRAAGTDSVVSPCCVVRKMLHREWGRIDSCFFVLAQGGHRG